MALRDRGAGGVPHTYTGVAVSVLFIGRLVYRIVELYSVDQSSGSRGALVASRGIASPAMATSHFTVGLLFVVIGYHVCYHSMVLWKSKRISPEDLEAVATSATASP